MNEATEKNKYALLNFKRTFRTPDDKEGTQEFQEVVFYEMNSDGTYENGTTLEEMLRVSIERLNDLNMRFPCRENALAITKMEEALMWLNKRTENRIAHGVEGKHII
jgi:hypothetical protein